MESYQELINRKKIEYGDKFDASDLNPEFIPAYESQESIEVDFGFAVKRGRVGLTTGWRPIFLLMLRRDSQGSVYTIGENARIIGELI